MSQKSSIRYVGNIRHFSPGATANGSYSSVQEALKGHLDYIADSERKGRDQVVTSGLDWNVWKGRADRLLEQNSTARVASKISLALPMDMKIEDGPDFVRNFFAETEILNEQRKIKGKRILKKVTLPRDHVGVACHQGRGQSRFLNPHAHVVIYPRSAGGYSLDCSKSELKTLHSEWKKYLESQGYAIREDPEDLKGIHYGPKIHYDPEAKAKHQIRSELATITGALATVETVMKEETRIDVEAMKRIPLADILDRLGIEWKQSGTQIVCCARWRGDTQPSVSIQKVEGGRWLWHDHATGKGGSCVDLVMIDRGLSYPDALRWLQGHLRDPGPRVAPTIPDASAPPEAGKDKEPFKVKGTFEKASGKAPALLREHRGLGWEDFAAAGGRLIKIQWASGKESWKIGWKNRSEGWEVKDIREGAFSGCAGHKDISVHGPKSDTVVVAESLLDGLAAAQLNRIEKPFILSLNSTSLATRAITWLIEKRPLKALLALDVDEGPGRGLETTRKIEEACQAAGISTERIFRGPQKDPCAALVAKLREEQAAKRKREAVITTRPTWPAP